MPNRPKSLGKIAPADSNSYLAAIVESSDDAIIGKTLDGNITSWNTAAERVFGYTAAEAIGQHINLIIPTDRRDEELVILGKIKQGERIEHFETLRRTKDGRLVNISLTVSPIRNGEGVVVGASKTARDITEMRNAERVSAHLAAIIDSSDDAIVSKNLDGIIQSWNKAAERVFGFTAAEAVGKHIFLIIPEDRIDEEYGILGKVRAGERLEHFETVRRRKDGTPVDIALTVSPIRDRQGKIIGVSKIARDITEQKRTEEALREMNLRKDEFLANMSHELRTPMNAVIGLANILKMSEPLTDKGRRYVSTLKQSADNLMTLINNLLDFSRLEAGSLDLEEAEFSLPEIIGAATGLISVAAKEKGLAVTAEYEPKLNKYYIGDAFRLQQIITNLLSNAVKFTPHGAITINVTGQPAADNRTMLAIAVTDTGIGIPAGKLEAIFEKFTQADSSTTRRYGGSGLGLSISRGFAEKMGGSVSASSREGLGSVFTLRLPLRKGERYAEIETAAAAAQGRKNVLVVDDYEPNILVLTSLLDRYGYDYDVAENGLEAVRKFRDGQYDVVLMDVQMHDMDGFESTQQIRAYERERQQPRTPVVGVTAHVLERDKQKCVEAGMDDFIAKPFEPARLSAVLEKLIARQE